MQRARVHIAGSAAPDACGPVLEAAHEFVRSLSSNLIDSGRGIVLGIGDEPLGDAGLPCTFDWTILEAISGTPDYGIDWPSDRLGRFRIVASQRAVERIPDSRRPLWEVCVARRDLELHLSPPGWRMGGIVRAEQALSGDVLVAIGGGAGVEHLAMLYLDEGKSVLPIQCRIGSSVGDGSGGSVYLHGRALNETSVFFDLRDGAGNSTARLSSLRVDDESQPDRVALETASLIGDLRSPVAFYVRLLSKDLDEFERVDSFFRNIVDPVIENEGFMPYEIGRDYSDNAFMNVEIFEKLHRASLVVVDLTGVRPNCTLELGYALARRRRVLITAMHGTLLPFDSDKLPTLFWRPDESDESNRNAFQIWLARHIDIAPIVA